MYIKRLGISLCNTYTDTYLCISTHTSHWFFSVEPALPDTRQLLRTLMSRAWTSVVQGPGRSPSAQTGPFSCSGVKQASKEHRSGAVPTVLGATCVSQAVLWKSRISTNTLCPESFLFPPWWAWTLCPVWSPQGHGPRAATLNGERGSGRIRGQYRREADPALVCWVWTGPEREPRAGPSELQDAEEARTGRGLALESSRLQGGEGLVTSAEGKGLYKAQRENRGAQKTPPSKRGVGATRASGSPGTHPSPRSALQGLRSPADICWNPGWLKPHRLLCLHSATIATILTKSSRGPEGETEAGAERNPLHNLSPLPTGY